MWIDAISVCAMVDGGVSVPQMHGVGMHVLGCEVCWAHPATTCGRWPLVGMGPHAIGVGAVMGRLGPSVCGR